MNVLYFISLLTTTKIELNSVPVMGSLDSGSFTIKFNDIKLNALSGTYNGCSSLYGRY